MMKEYVYPVLEILPLYIEDIITDSGSVYDDYIFDDIIDIGNQGWFS